MQYSVVLGLIQLAAQTHNRDTIRAFYERHTPALKFGNAIADIVLVPILALNLVGIVSINGRYAPWVVSIVALVEVLSTAILLVSGYFAPSATPHVACAACRGKMTPEVQKWKCENCGAELIPVLGNVHTSRNPSNP